MTAATMLTPVRRKEPKVRYNDNGDVILPRGAEFVDGRVVYKRRRHGPAMSESTNWTGNRILTALHEYVSLHRTGVVFRGAADQGFQCFPRKPLQVRRADVSFVRRDMAKFFLRDSGWTLEVPELIVEVVSPEDRFHCFETRIEDFLAAGTKLIWIVDPLLEKAFVIHPDGIRYPLGKTDCFDGEDVLPGFRLPLADILPPKPPK